MGKALELTESKRIEIAESLFQVKNKSGSELIGLCPFHSDKNSSFSYNFEKDVYNCYTSCVDAGDLIQLWSKINGFENSKGFSNFCEEFGLGKKKKSETQGATKTPTSKKAKKQAALKTKKKFIPKESDYKQLAETFEKFPKLPEPWVEKLSKTRKWTKEAIEQLDLRVQTHYRDKSGEIRKIFKNDNKKIAFPIRDRVGKLVNIIVYNPSAKKAKMMSWSAGFGTGRTYPNAPMKSGTVHYVEGISDVVCALSQGLNPITHTTKVKTWKDDDLSVFAGCDVVIVPDADIPGFKYAKFALNNFMRVAGSASQICWPEEMGQRPDGSWPSKKGQDITDFFARHGKTIEDFHALEREDFTVDTAQPNPHEYFCYGVNERLSFKSRLLAERLVNKEFELISEPETGYMYRWNKRYWELFDDFHIKKRAIELLGEESQKSRVEDAFYQLEKMSTIPHGRKLNDREEWISMKNGMLRLSSIIEDEVEFIPHQKDFYCSWELPFEFNPSSKTICKRFIRFLEQTVKTNDAIMQVQEYMGYCFTRDCRFGKVLLLKGPGSDGKSILIKILRKIVGPQNCSSISFRDLEDQFHRSSLYNKLLNISTEVGSKALESEYFKAISTGDPISAAFKHQNVFEFLPYCKLIFSANRLPRVLDNSHGFFRRLLLIQFKRQFFEDDEDNDPLIEDKLTEELPEIFHWALVGLARLWKNNRFTQSVETNELVQDYKRLNNPVIGFVEDMCEVGESKEFCKRELFDHYKKYCRQNEYKPFGNAKFFNELQTAIQGLKTYRPRIEGKGRGRYIKGIQVRDLVSSS
jgi:putative DNA primase/helicase